MGMSIGKMFDVGEIMEWEDKPVNIAALSSDDCVIVSKVVNNHKIILHMKRQSDGSEGNVFIKLKEPFESNSIVFKKVLATKKVIGMSLNEFRKMDIEEL